MFIRDLRTREKLNKADQGSVARKEDEIMRIPIATLGGGTISRTVLVQAGRNCGLVVAKSVVLGVCLCAEQAIRFALMSSFPTHPAAAAAPAVFTLVEL